MYAQREDSEVLIYAVRMLRNKLSQSNDQDDGGSEVYEKVLLGKEGLTIISSHGHLNEIHTESTTQRPMTAISADYARLSCEPLQPLLFDVASLHRLDLLPIPSTSFMGLIDRTCVFRCYGVLFDQPRLLSLQQATGRTGALRC